MALINEVKAICDRLAPLGWRKLFQDVTGNSLDIQQATPAALKTALEKVVTINRGLEGFEDFHPDGKQAVTPGEPARSLLLHALACPRVKRDGAGNHLAGFPTLAEIETVENYIFARVEKTLTQIEAGRTLSVVVFAVEYRSAPDTPDKAHADMVFSRTGIARIGTADPSYRAQDRGFQTANPIQPHDFHVVPVRFQAWLAAPVKGDKARVMRLNNATTAEKSRTFWIPVHKLFDGEECIKGKNITLTGQSKLFNIKLQRVMKSVGVNKTGSPYVLEDQELGELRTGSIFGQFAIVPKTQTQLVKQARDASGKPLTYKVPKDKGNAGFATFQPRSEEDTNNDIDPGTGKDVEIRPFPAYIHARTQVKNGTLIDLNLENDVGEVVRKGNYEALLYVDYTGEGWLDIEATHNGAPLVSTTRPPAYVILSAPDFFPYSGQRELSEWTQSNDVPNKFKNQIWGIPPVPLTEVRLPANLQLTGATFDSKEDTISTVVAMGDNRAKSAFQFTDMDRASTLPDDAAGVFAPGWDVGTDKKGSQIHLAAYGLGSPFPEDSKLCAALSTFWPAVAPDVYRSMSMHTGNDDLRGTVAPLTDEEIGMTGGMPWDGIPGPRIIDENGVEKLELASFLHVDYTRSAIENRMSLQLTARITAEEYARRMIAISRVYWVLSRGSIISAIRKQWFVFSFVNIPTSNSELMSAGIEAGHALTGQPYRVEVCFIGANDPSLPSPLGPGLRRFPIIDRRIFFVSKEDTRALYKRQLDPRFAAVLAE